MTGGGEGLTAPLAWTAIVVALACALVLRPCVGARAAYVLAVLKVGITTVFFTFGDTGAWRILDDVTYTEEAARLLASGFGVGRILADPLAPEVVEAARGIGVGYYLLNVLAQALFGPHYWSTVFLNVLLSCIAARALFRLLLLAEVERPYRFGFLVFFLLHWDVLAWSSFLNLKDTLVLALSAWMCAWGAVILRRPSVFPFVMLAANAFVLYFVRHYAPVLFLGVFGAALAVARRGVWIPVFLAGAAVALAAGVGGTDLSHVDPSAPLAGAVSFLVTPRPWAVSENYGFLVLPSVLHWLLLPLAFLGGLSLWRLKPARLALLFGLALVAFYAVVPHLVGPRHRFQLAFLLAWMQFEGGYRLALQALRLRRGASRGAEQGAPSLYGPAA